MAINHIYELVHEQQFAGQQINNVYHFQATDSVVTPQNLADWFETNIEPDIRGRMHATWTSVNIRVRNLFLTSETAENPVGLTGTGAPPTDELPSFVAIGARFDHNLGGTRPGSKRWGILSEAEQDEGVWIASTVSAWQTIANKLVNPLAPAIAFNHVIVDRVCEEFDPLDPTRCIKWRLPETEAEANTGEVTGAEVQTQVTTQNTRKWYR